LDAHANKGETAAAKYLGCYKAGLGDLASF